MKLPCGGVAYLDPNSSINAMVCLNCVCVVGSMSMPDYCRKLLLEQQNEEQDHGE